MSDHAEILAAGLATASQTKPRQVPSVGRMVHVVTFEGHHRPATIIDPQDGETICVLVTVKPTDYLRDEAQHGGVLWYIDDCLHDEATKAPGTWHWPEYIPAR